MKSTLTQQPKPKVTYPCLRKLKTRNMIVLFFCEGKGTLMYDELDLSEGGPTVGGYSESWADEVFEDYTGTVTLSN